MNSHPAYACLAAVLVAVATGIVPSMSRAQCPQPDQVVGDLPPYADLAMASNGEWLAVADEGNPFVGPGTVYLYRLEGGAWALSQQMLTTPGWATLAISSKLLMVADPSSKVSIYELAGETWELSSTISAPSGSAGRFGGTMDMRGDRALISDARSGYVYTRPASGGWPLEATLTPRLVHEEGWSVIHSSLLDPHDAEARAVVAIRPPVFLEPAALVIFERRGGLWEETLLVPTGAGWLRRVEEPLLACADRLGVDIYEDRGDELRLVDRVEREFTQPDPGSLSAISFGRSAATAPSDPPDLLLIGDDRTRATIDHEGRALLFAASGSEWERVATLLMPPEATWSGVGRSLTLSSAPGRAARAIVRAGGPAATAFGSFSLDRLCGDCPLERAPAGEVTLTVRAAHDITPANPATTVEVVAWFPADDHAIAGVRFDVEAAEPAFQDPVVRLGSLGTLPGTVTPDGTAVRGIVAAQPHFLPTTPADPANPIVLWTATFTTDDFRPREIDVHVPAVEFVVYPDQGSPAIATRLDRLVPTPGFIRVRQTADCDGSGVLDFADFLCFQNRFAAGDPRADFDGDGEFTFFDFLAFQNAFAEGCS